MNFCKELSEKGMLKPENEVSPDEWEELAEMAENFKAEQSVKAPEAATSFYKAALEVEKDFDSRMETIRQSDNEMSQREFEKWEDALSDEIGYAEEELRKTDGKIDTIAESEQAMIFSTNEQELHRTIEAQAGRFYHARMSSLREAIQDSGNQAAKEDLDYAQSFYSTVMKHLDFKYMSPEDVRNYGFDEYERGRTKAHNDAIKHLNGINDLAEKYHVRPFTIRNFWPSDIRDKKNQTSAISSVMRYDRDLVEEYYAVAFSSEVERIKRAKNARARLFR